MALFSTLLYGWIFIHTTTHTFGWGLGEEPEAPHDRTERVLKEISDLLESNYTVDYLSTFNSSFERRIVYTQLEACPYHSLCTFNFPHIDYPAMPNPNDILCCNYCSCDFPYCLDSTQFPCCLDTLIQQNNVYEVKPTTETCVTSSPLRAIPTGFNMKPAQCLLNTDKELVRNCTNSHASNLADVKAFVPVYDLVTLDVYQNIYCAHCNNISDENIEKADILFQCLSNVQPNTEEELITSVMARLDCNLKYEFPQLINKDSHQCLLSVPECNVTGQWLKYDPEIEQACRMSAHIFRIDGIRFQNIFCALCNGYEYDNQLVCEDKTILHASSYGFSGVLNIDAFINYTSQEDTNDACSTNQIYDYVYDTCRDLYCPPYKTLQNGECIDLYTSLRDVVYVFNLKVVPSDVTTVLQADAIGDELLDQIDHLIGRVCINKLIYKIETDFNKLHTIDVLNAHIKYFLLEVELNQNVYQEPEEYINTYLSIFELELSVLYTMKDKDEIETFKGQLQLTDQHASLFDKMTTSLGNELSLQEFIDKFAVAGDLSGVLVPHRYALRHYYRTCSTVTTSYTTKLMRMKPCSVVKLLKNETEWFQDDDGIVLVHGDVRIEHSDFYIEDNDTLVVCSGVYKMIMTFQKTTVSLTYTMEDERFNNIVSVTCTGVSMTSLGVTFVAFCMLPQLRAMLPGKNNMFLVLTMFCANSLYLVTGFSALEGGSTGCQVVGILLHLIWLFSMFWLNICTVHLCHVFKKTKLGSGESQLFRFLLCVCYALIMSVLPVVINIAVSLSTSDSIGYGDDACFVSSRNLSTYTFGVPMALVVITNISMFLGVMIKIKIGEMTKNNMIYERNSFIILVMLSIIIGITWICGYVYIWTELVLFSYLFDVFNAVQSVFLLIGFVFNYRVLNVSKDKHSSSGLTRQLSVQSGSNDNAEDKDNCG